jgi:hypothetical protein
MRTWLSCPTFVSGTVGKYKKTDIAQVARHVAAMNVNDVGRGLAGRFCASAHLGGAAETYERFMATPMLLRLDGYLQPLGAGTQGRVSPVIFQRGDLVR